MTMSGNSYFRNALVTQQQRLMKWRHAELLAAVNGSFTSTAASCLSLSSRDRVQVVWQWLAQGIERRGEVDFGFFSAHEIAVGLRALRDGEIDDSRCNEGGVLYLAGVCPGLFWSMVLHWKEFGSTVPMVGNGAPAVLPQWWRTVQAEWDRVFRRAVESETNVDCLFFCTAVGCAAGPSECPLRHSTSRWAWCRSHTAMQRNAAACQQEAQQTIQLTIPKHLSSTTPCGSPPKCSSPVSVLDSRLGQSVPAGPRPSRSLPPLPPSHRRVPAPGWHDLAASASPRNGSRPGWHDLAPDSPPTSPTRSSSLHTIPESTSAEGPRATSARPHPMLLLDPLQVSPSSCHPVAALPLSPRMNLLFA